MERNRGEPAASLVAALLLVALPVGCDGDRDPVPAAGSEPGRRLFESYCAPCHRADGRGMEDGAPPLLGSPWVAGPEKRLIRIVLHGLRGPIEIEGKTYDLLMLGFAPVLTDEEVAALLSYVRERCGGPSPPIRPATVQAVRAASPARDGYWTVAELLRG